MILLHERVLHLFGAAVPRAVARAQEHALGSQIQAPLVGAFDYVRERRFGFSDHPGVRQVHLPGWDDAKPSAHVHARAGQPIRQHAPQRVARIAHRYGQRIARRPANLPRQRQRRTVARLAQPPEVPALGGILQLIQHAKIAAGWQNGGTNRAVRILHKRHVETVVVEIQVRHGCPEPLIQVPTFPGRGIKRLRAGSAGENQIARNRIPERLLNRLNPAVDVRVDALVAVLSQIRIAQQRVELPRHDHVTRGSIHRRGERALHAQLRQRKGGREHLLIAGGDQTLPAVQHRQRFARPQIDNRQSDARAVSLLERLDLPEDVRRIKREGVLRPSGGESRQHQRDQYEIT